MELTREVLKLRPETAVLIITAYGTIASAVEALKLGAGDYITKPFQEGELTLAVARALKWQRLASENREYRRSLTARAGFSEIITSDPALKDVIETAVRVAASDATVLIRGESGTGKELLARAIHAASERSESPMVTVNCSAIPDGLLESELFGHRKGAFTGAVENRLGKFELAAGGTVFLDEIGDLKVGLQAKLLRVLQEREVERVGEGTPRPVDIRVVAASHRDLAELVERGEFREDLFYRLSVVVLTIPPLRDRIADIHQLIKTFWEKYGGRGEPNIGPEAAKALREHTWPGNVRELENFVQRTLALGGEGGGGGGILPENILSPGGDTAHVGKGAGEDWPLPLPADAFNLEEANRQIIIEALDKHRGNKSRTAAYLGISRHTLLYRLKKYGLRWELCVI
jgi:DNA-binding NtrC family response regulator